MDLRLKSCRSTTVTLQNDLNCGDDIVLDRFTNLPDELLIRILSLLPTKDAAVTSILSKRMSSIFPFITSLDFDKSPICHCLIRPFAIQRFPTFVAFVDSVLSTHQSKYLTKFKLGVGEDFMATSCGNCECNLPGGENDCCPDLKPSLFNAWIAFPLTRCGLRELDLRIQVEDPGDCLLPLEIFTYETLEVLKLDTNLGLDRTSTLTSFHLSHLKVLHLRVAFISEVEFVTRLVSSCPLLEDLMVYINWEHGYFVNISSPSLRILSLFANIDNDFEFHKKFVLINTPNLEYLKYTDFLASQYSVPNMNSLVKADVCLANCLYEEQDEFCLAQLFASIRPLFNVQHLTLTGAYTQDLCRVDLNVLKDQLPVFHNLNCLELNYRFNSWDKLVPAFLNCSPVLEALVFPRGLVSDPPDLNGRNFQNLEREVFSKAPAVIPSCCRNHLKRIVVKYYCGIEREICLIQFLLRHALALEELVLFRATYAEADWMVLENALQNLPRASVACSIQVLDAPMTQ